MPNMFGSHRDAASHPGVLHAGLISWGYTCCCCCKQRLLLWMLLDQQVWRLPDWLVEPRPGELKLLKRLLDSEDVLGLLRKQAVVA